MDRLKGKIALITARGNRGRPRRHETVRRRGAIRAAWSCPRPTDETLAQVKAAGGDGRIVAADLRPTPDGAEQAVAKRLRPRTDRHSRELCRSRLQLVSEEEPDRWGQFDDTTPEKWAEVMAINLDSVFHMPARDPSDEEAGRRFDRQRHSDLGFQACRAPTPTLPPERRPTLPARSNHHCAIRHRVAWIYRRRGRPVSPHELEADYRA